MDLNRTGTGKKLINQIINKNADALKKHQQPKKAQPKSNKNPRNS